MIKQIVNSICSSAYFRHHLLLYVNAFRSSLSKIQFSVLRNVSLLVAPLPTQGARILVPDPMPSPCSRRSSESVSDVSAYSSCSLPSLFFPLRNGCPYQYHPEYLYRPVYCPDSHRYLFLLVLGKPDCRFHCSPHYPDRRDRFISPGTMKSVLPGGVGSHDFGNSIWSTLGKNPVSRQTIFHGGNRHQLASVYPRDFRHDQNGAE